MGAERQTRTGRMAACLAGAAVCAACSAGAPMATDAGSAWVRNALAGGVVSSVFFGVQSVDGVAVHAKFDRDREVALAAGTRVLTLRYYAQGLWSEPQGESECSLTVDAQAGAVYRVEGVARDGRWRARLVDDRDGTAIDCVFADGTTWGAVRGGGAAEVAARAEPTEAAAAATAKIEGGGVDRAAPAQVEDAPAESGLTGRAKGPHLGAAPAAAAPATGAPPPSSGFLAGMRKVVNRNMDVDWGCQVGYLRARGLAADGTLVLKGSERIRLLGVASIAAEKVDLDDACVRLAFDDETKLAGERDQQGRLLAYVFLPDGSFVNEELLRAGDARVETRWRHRYLGAFLAAQSEARDAGRGLWARR